MLGALSLSAAVTAGAGVVDDLPVSISLAELAAVAASSDDPSPLSVEVVRRLDADDIAEAAGAMEALREQAATMETRARNEHVQALSLAERWAHDEALRVSKTLRRPSSSARRSRCSASSPSDKRRSAGRRPRR